MIFCFNCFALLRFPSSVQLYRNLSHSLLLHLLKSRHRLCTRPIFEYGYHRRHTRARLSRSSFPSLPPSFPSFILKVHFSVEAFDRLRHFRSVRGAGGQATHSALLSSSTTKSAAAQFFNHMHLSGVVVVESTVRRRGGAYYSCVKSTWESHVQK